MAEQDATSTERRGRPRRFDERTERAMVMDAAIELLSGGDATELAVVDVLAATGLSTRSFYRHFDSKDALLVALVHREAERVAAAMERAMAGAAGPADAVEAWLDRLLDTFYEPRRAARSALLVRHVASGEPATTVELGTVRWTLARPLAEALRAGHEAGALTSPDPRADALTLFAIAGAAAHPGGAERPARSVVRAHVVRFAWPALGLAGPDRAAADEDRGAPAAGR